MDLWAQHKPLPLLAEETFRLPEEAHHLITLLNQTLKKRGLIFGLRQTGDAFTFSIYEAEPWETRE